MRIHRCLSTHLYGTQQAGLITGSSLTITGTSACAIPVDGWFVGPTLIAGRMRLSFSLSPKGIHIPERGKFFVWFNSGSKKFYWQRIEIESGIQAPQTRKAKPVPGNRNPQTEIQNPRLSWITLQVHGAISLTLSPGRLSYF